MLQRLASDSVVQRLARYPAVALVGPRQCGKTTLARALPGVYLDLEQESDRLRLDLSWDSLCAGKELVILDEAQSWPEVFPRLRGTIDADRKRAGRFLLLGSIAPTLMHQVSESLAGRLSLVELTPFLRGELQSTRARRRHWFYGGYPDGGVLSPKAYPDWQADYLALLVQRDLPQWGLPAKPQTTTRMFKMLAALHGQPWNASSLGASLGLSYHTVDSYLDYLEGAYLIRRLPSYQPNLRKRLVKRPRVFIRDSGLLHAVLNVRDEDALLDQPWVGASWEGYVIEQVLGHLSAVGTRHQAYWFRTSDGHELDLVLDFGGEVWAIEIKLTSAPTAQDLRRASGVAELLGAQRCFLVSQAATPRGEGRVVSTHLEAFLSALREREV